MKLEGPFSGWVPCGPLLSKCLLMVLQESSELNSNESEEQSPFSFLGPLGMTLKILASLSSVGTSWPKQMRAVYDSGSYTAELGRAAAQGLGCKGAPLL